MKTMQVHLLSFSQIRERQKTHPLRQSEVPVEHAVSLPLPTKRWGEPAYAFFASPAFRIPGKPVEQGPPDRWWAVKAHGGAIMIYALWSVVRYTEGANWST